MSRWTIFASSAARWKVWKMILDWLKIRRTSGPCRRERDWSLSHRRLRAEPRPVMWVNYLKWVWFTSEHKTNLKMSGPSFRG